MIALGMVDDCAEVEVTLRVLRIHRLRKIERGKCDALQVAPVISWTVTMLTAICAVARHGELHAVVG